MILALISPSLASPPPARAKPLRIAGWSARAQLSPVGPVHLRGHLFAGNAQARRHRPRSRVVESDRGTVGRAVAFRTLEIQQKASQ